MGIVFSRFKVSGSSTIFSTLESTDHASPYFNPLAPPLEASGQRAALLTPHHARCQCP